MKRSKVKAYQIEEMIKASTSPALQKKIGEEVISIMKESLDSGLSPVRGERRFEKYKDPKKYPGKKKSKLPVNLKLTGDMLNALRVWISGGRLMVGIKNPKEAIKANAHNDGISPQPRRHFMPTDKGDEFTVTITRQIRNLYAKILSDIMKGRGL